MNRAATLLDPRLRPCPVTIGGPANPLMSLEDMQADLWRLALNRLQELMDAGHQVCHLSESQRVWQTVMTRVGTARPDDQALNLAAVHRELTGTITAEQSAVLAEFAGQLLSPRGSAAWRRAQNLAEQLIQTDNTGQYAPSTFYLLQGEAGPNLMELLHDTPEQGFDAGLNGLAAQLAWNLGLTTEQQLTRLSLNGTLEPDRPDLQARRDLLSEFTAVQAQARLASLRGESITPFVSRLNAELRTHHAILGPEMIPNLPGIRTDVPMGLPELRAIPEIMSTLHDLGVDTERLPPPLRPWSLKATWQTGLHWGNRHDTGEQALILMRGLPLHAWINGEQTEPTWLAAQLCADLKRLKSPSAPADLTRRLRQHLNDPNSVASSFTHLNPEDQATLSQNVTLTAGQRRNSTTAHLMSLLSTNHEDIAGYLKWSTKPAYDTLLDICRHHPRLTTGIIRLLLHLASQHIPTESGWQGDRLREAMLDRLIDVTMKSPGYAQFIASLGSETGSAGKTRQSGLPLLCLAVLMSNQSGSVNLSDLTLKLSTLKEWTVRGPQATWTALGGSPGALTLTHALMTRQASTFYAALATHSRDPFGLPTNDLHKHTDVPAHEVSAGPPSPRDHELARLICTAFDLGPGLITRQTESTLERA